MTVIAGPAGERSERRTKLALFLAIVFFYWMSLYLYVPTLPTYAQTKTANLALVGTILAQYGLWQAIVRLPIGIASDWIGRRKPFILIGMVFAGAGAYVMGTAGDATGLLIGRAITGLAAGTWVPLVVAFSSLFPPAEAVRASALLTFVGSVGRVLATSTTGPLNNMGGYGLPFLIAAGVAAVALLITVAVPEKRLAPKPPSLDRLGRLATRRDVLLPSLLSAVSQYVVWGVSFGFLPILAKQLGADPVTLSLFTTINLLCYIGGNLTATTAVKRFGAPRMAYFSFTLMALGTAGAALAPSLPALMLAQIGLGIATGVGYPVLMGMSIVYVAEHERATAMGLHQAVYAIGMFAGPWLSGIVAQLTGIRLMFGATALAALLLGWLGTHQLRTQKEP
ncbi:MAG: MFS transporter [Anaerolineae bacterium]|nr:MFS transporter [Anaerolineae bacterium]